LFNPGVKIIRIIKEFLVRSYGNMQLFSTIKKRVKNSISFLTDENTAKKIVNKIKVHERI